VRSQDHHNPSTRPISLADTALAASARLGDTVATADPDLLDAARAEGLATVVLPGQG
jgi:hypothetical protein